MLDGMPPVLGEVPVVELAADTDHALSLLADARQSGGIRSATGEIYELPLELDSIVRADPWRARLTPWALEAIAHPDEAWLFRGGEPTDEPIEHRPHFMVARSSEEGTAFAIEVGTRRVNGRMRVQTWYRIVYPLPLIESYWAEAVRFWPPARQLRSLDDRDRDILLLMPDPPEEWDGHWLPAPTGALLLERSHMPIPLWIGIEIHEFRTAWGELSAHPPFHGLFSSPVSIDGGPISSLADQLALLSGS
jgi:hypothetical protein